MIPISDDNPTKIKPIVSVSIIVICVAVFFWELTLTGTREELLYAFTFVPGSLFDSGAYVPEIIIIPPVFTIITSMFLHGGWMHLIGNMLYLWIFGNNVEDSMGHVRFIVFYLVTGIIASLAHALPNPSSTIPTLGASGAISGVLGAYLLLYPRSKVKVLIPLGFIYKMAKLPAGLVLGFWFVLQIISSASGGLSGGGVAWGAHIGGFIGGMALIPFFKYRSFPLFKS